ncbi:bromodomain-containing protein DDB_G0280777 isoform X3 [Leptopilina boulardi]|uniref:bromodomain-containing protein DDB_G0280777 isoform X3 n=1 Tax=Leptopilina boulardi TaxID=63433 RepID=UPI0021F678ED|nr:bromodomain-containing protein DDB_G0280777 isoform X3 [Leptopilina boulardi]
MHYCFPMPRWRSNSSRTYFSFWNFRKVVGGSADGSDSELLLRNDAIPCNSSPPPPPSASSSHLRQSESPPPAVNTPVSPTPPATNEEQTNSNPTRQLSFEEFECDVSVAEGGGRRQEFSFTLYGVDGHGRISKDDIAGLVKAIYDTLGSKIQAPSCGQIKVKLTVSPDQRSATHGTPKTATSSQNRNSSCCHVTHVDPCSHANQISSRRTHRRRRAPRHRFQSEQQQQQQQQPARNPSDEDAENIPTNPSKEEELRRRVGPVPHLISPYSNSSEGDVSEASDISPTLTPLTPLVSNHRKRSAAMQRQQLFEIIQANMEKNNLGVNNSSQYYLLSGSTMNKYLFEVPMPNRRVPIHINRNNNNNNNNKGTSIIDIHQTITNQIESQFSRVVKSPLINQKRIVEKHGVQMHREIHQSIRPKVMYIRKSKRKFFNKMQRHVTLPKLHNK